MQRFRRIWTVFGLVLLAGAARAGDRCPDWGADRNLYWGDLHVHTAFSFDANSWDVRALPPDAYRFARGEPLLLPPLDAEGRPTRPIQLERPLDFAAVTDHAELMGELWLCVDPGSEVHGSGECRFARGEAGLAGFAAWSASSPLGRNLVAPVIGWLRGPTAARAFRDPGYAAALRVMRWLAVKNGSEPRSAELCGADGARCLDAAASVWARTQAAANRALEPCSFTAFNAYEYSGAPGGSNLHRNVIFRGEAVPAHPISFVEARRPDLLWRELVDQCLDAGTGCDALAIPHNPNRSNGRLLGPEYGGATGAAEQAQLAALRQRLEPLVEISQHKGDSECRNGMFGVVGAEDELCDYEKYRLIGKTRDAIASDARAAGDIVEDSSASAADCGAESGRGGFAGCGHRRDYVRYALVEGLAEEERLGVNPLKLGIIASTDAHNANPGDVEEYSFDGNFGTQDGDPRLRLVSNRPPGGIQSNPGGLVAVWAEENTRDAIFEALRRRETYGTSGPRMALRFFGAWDYPDDLCGGSDFVARASASGVPMGGDLPKRPSDSTSPSFALWAARDPGTPEHPGADLERIQVVKGWVGAGGEIRQAVYDVATSRDLSDEISLETCQSPPGEAQLCRIFRDPDFDPGARAVYYARAVERPACRYSWRDCQKLPDAERPETCGDPSIPRAIRERAWSSPIWYTP